MEVIFRKLDSKIRKILPVLQSGKHASCVYFHLSNLPKSHQSLVSSQKTIQHIQSVYNQQDGYIFLFFNNDVMVVFNESMQDVEVSELLYGLMNKLDLDPKSQMLSEFATILHVPHQFEEVLSLIGQQVPIDDYQTSDILLLTNEDNNIVDANIERYLQNVDIESLICKQAISAFYSLRGEIKPLFHEVSLDLSDVRRDFWNRFEALPNHYLDSYISFVLNKRLLKYLTSNIFLCSQTALSINVSPEIILSAEFREFDRALKKATKNTVVLEISLRDAFMDIPTFYHATSYAKNLGYKICLDDLDEISIALVSREVLGVDFGKIKIRNSDYTSDDIDVIRAMSSSLKNFGENKLIMVDANNQSIINFGKSLGIHLFQGIRCDEIIRETSRLHEAVL